MNRIDDALDILNQAAKEKREEFSKILTGKYSHLKGAVLGSVKSQTESFDELRENLEETFKESGEILRETTTTLDRQVRENPWPYLSAAAAAGALLGFILSRSKR